jgi:prepilin-type processing-associated H-X9-DG protein
MLLPAIKMVRDQASSLRCQNNLKQIGLGCLGYLQDLDSYPDTSVTAAIYWHTLIEPYIEAEGDSANKNAALRNKRGVLRSCPAWKSSIYYAVVAGQSVNGSTNDGDWNPGYGMNPTPFRPDATFWNHVTVAYWGVYTPYRQATVTNVTLPSGRILVGDSPDWYFSNSIGRDDRQRHRGRSNSVFFDGHTQSLPPSSVPYGISDPAHLP